MEAREVMFLQSRKKCRNPLEVSCMLSIDIWLCFVSSLQSWIRDVEEWVREGKRPLASSCFPCNYSFYEEHCLFWFLQSPLTIWSCSFQARCKIFANVKLRLKELEKKKKTSTIIFFSFIVKTGNAFSLQHQHI